MLNFVKADATSYLYHYTSERCSNRIVETGVIRASLNENILFGHGVYLSPLSPDYGKKAILFNNYGQYRKWYTKYKVVCYLFQDQEKSTSWCVLSRNERWQSYLALPE